MIDRGTLDRVIRSSAADAGLPVPSGKQTALRRKSHRMATCRPGSIRWDGDDMTFRAAPRRRASSPCYILGMAPTPQPWGLTPIGVSQCRIQRLDTPRTMSGSAFPATSRGPQHRLAQEQLATWSTSSSRSRPPVNAGESLARSNRSKRYRSGRPGPRRDRRGDPSSKFTRIINSRPHGRRMVRLRLWSETRGCAGSARTKPRSA